ncbi:hypothetical protein BJ166DRAFT_166137 [Pestalotiopsis sp. NC0098]|nr:hypothetical protein BJ166DRAFT_166137 [Pestalotiopsis sp. NC0098]
MIQNLLIERRVAVPWVSQCVFVSVLLATDNHGCLSPGPPKPAFMCPDIFLTGSFCRDEDLVTVMIFINSGPMPSLPKHLSGYSPLCFLVACLSLGSPCNQQLRPNMITTLLEEKRR